MFPNPKLLRKNWILCGLGLINFGSSFRHTSESGKNTRTIPKQNVFNVETTESNAKAGGRSYAKVVADGWSRDQGPGTSRRVNRNATFKNNRWSGPDFNVSEEQMGCLKVCYVGKTFDPEGIPCITKKLRMEGIISKSLMPMGGNSILIRALEGKV